MISLDVAKQNVSAYLDSISNDDYSLILNENETREDEFGWIFFYNSKQFLIDKDPAYQLAGNSPLLVDKYSGKIFITGTSHSLGYYIEKYKKDKNSLTEVIY